MKPLAQSADSFDDTMPPEMLMIWLEQARYASVAAFSLPVAQVGTASTHLV